MSELSGLLYLTPNEVTTIKEWINGKGYTLEKGYFELQYDFSPYGDSILAVWHQQSKVDFLEVYDDMQQRQSLETPVERIVLDGVEVGLTLSDEQLGNYLRSARECTEAHLAVDCEPPGSGLVLRIQKGACSLIAGRNVIGTINFDPCANP